MKKLLALLMAVSAVFFFSCSNESGGSSSNEDNENGSSGTNSDTTEKVEIEFDLNLLYKTNKNDTIYNNTKVESIEKAIGTTITLPSTDCYYYTANSIDKLYYDFAGWNTKSDGSGTSYKAGDNFVLNKYTILYAQYEVRDTFTGTDFERQLIGSWGLSTYPNRETYIMFNLDFTGEIKLNNSIYTFNWATENSSSLIISNSKDSISDSYERLNGTYTISISSTEKVSSSNYPINELKLTGALVSETSESTSWYQAED